MSRRADPVTKTMRLEVFRLDQGCVAPRLGADTPCSGRWTLDHVKDQPRLGVRAPSDLAHLVCICEGHSEGGARAGYQWNTAKENRRKLREYLAQR